MADLVSDNSNIFIGEVPFISVDPNTGNYL